jgi:DNA polymerase III subunit beta
MKLQISRTLLVQALQRLQGITEKKSNMPILANALLQATNEGTLIFSATDLELSYRTQVDAEIEEIGSTTVSAKKLLEITRELFQEQVVLQTLPNDRLVILAGRSYFELSTIPVDDFPYLTFYEDAQFLSFEAGDIRECLEKTDYVIPTEEDPFSIAGLYWHVMEDKLYRFVASDGHRLAYMQTTSSKFESMAINTGVIIPRKGVQEILRMLEVCNEFDLAIHENCLVMKAPHTVLAIRLLEDEFPEYQQIIPEERPIVIQIDRLHFLQALKRIATLTNQKWRHVRLTAKPGVLVLESGNPEVGNASDEVDVDYQGEEFTTAFNIRYLMEAVQCMHSSMIRFEWVDGDHGGIFLGDDDPGYLALIMPMIL